MNLPDKVRGSAKWCVSKDKVPLDLYALDRGQEWGASFKRSHPAYRDYEGAKAASEAHGLPMTLFVDSLEQDICMLDIEKTCPKNVRVALLENFSKDIIYLEKSLSGKGYHAMISLPSGTDIATAKYKKWFELLAGHHCTFTRNEVHMKDAMSEDIGENELTSEEDADIISQLTSGITPVGLYNLLCKSKSIVLSDAPDMAAYKEATKTFDGKHADLFNMLCDVTYAKTLDDFAGDFSRYEYGYASSLTYKCRNMAKSMLNSDGSRYELPLVKEQVIVLVYMVLKQSLPSRPKHMEMRNGLPWLLYTAQQVYIKTFPD